MELSPSREAANCAATEELPSTQDNVTSIAKPPQYHKNCQLETEKTIKQNRKLPVTRKDDFLWDI
jgi:hypothetical protein